MRAFSQSPSSPSILCLVVALSIATPLAAQQGHSSKSASAVSHFETGMAEMDKARRPQALDHFQRAVAADPAWGRAHLQLSNASRAAADRTLHLGHAVQHLATATPAERLVIEAAKQWADRDQPGRLASLTKLVELTPNDPRAWLLHGAALGQNNRAADARLSYRKALEVAPDFAPALLAAINNYAVAPRDLPSAEGLARRWVQLDAQDARAHGAMGRVMTLQARYAEALTSIDTQLRLDSTVFIRTARIVPLALMGDYGRALQELDGVYARADSGTKVNVAQQRVLVHAMRGDMGSAAEAAERGYADARAMRVSGRGAVAFIGLALVNSAWARGDAAAMTAAVAGWRRAAEGASLPADTAFARIVSSGLPQLAADGVAAALRKDAAGARAIGAQYLASAGAIPAMGHEIMAMADLYDGKHADAVAHFEQASQTNMVTMYYRAMALYGAGRASDAKPLFDRVANENVFGPAAILRDEARKKAAAIR